MTTERHERSFERDKIDWATNEECPTLELPRDHDADTEHTPPTLTMGWAARDEELFAAEDTNPEMLIWPVDDDGSLRDTIRDGHAFERTQIIDLDEVMGVGEVPMPADIHALSDLAGAVGHELNNPLTSCVGYLRQISDLVSSEDDLMARMVDRLGRNLNRIHSIVGELEMLAAESTERRTKVDLAVVVERVHRQLATFLDVDVDLDVHQAYLLADRPRLYQLAYIMLAAYMLDDEISAPVTVHVSSRTVGACLEITSPKKPQGSLRLDLLGILRRETVGGSTPLGLAAQLTRAMGGSWHESQRSDSFRVSAVLPRRFPVGQSDARPRSADSTSATRRRRRARAEEPRRAGCADHLIRADRPTDEG